MKTEALMAVRRGVDGGKAATGESCPDSGNWSELYRRIEASRAAMQRRLTPGPEERRKILRARARSLAVRDETEAKASIQRVEIVEFTLGSERYGVETRFVREIHPLTEFTSLPSTPAFVLGLVNVRGQILSIINLKKLLELPEKGITDLNKVIIVQDGQMEVGILADAILGIRVIPSDELCPSLPTLTGIREEYLKGITKDLLGVLNLESVLADEKLVVDEE
jgi:purine-binding chemotaxis protein CheW